MPLIQRYVLRRILIAFGSGLVVLTAIIWATQALQRLDLVTAKGQTLILFAELTVLAVPFLATLIAPIAFVIAMLAIYDRLNRDNELAVMSAAGASRRALLQPALAAAALVSVLIAISAFYIAPQGLKSVRVLLTEIRADIVSSIVQPGNFMDIEQGLVVHIRDRRADGSLQGLLLSDERDPEQSMTYIAETARVVEAVDRTLLVMGNGSVQRLDRRDDELSVAEFEAYAFDLTNLIPEDVEAVFKPSERTLSELLDPAENDAYVLEHRDQFRVEIHDRMTQPLYPIVFALIAFVFVGDPRTNRQSRVAAIVAAAVLVGTVRLAGYGATMLSLASPAAVPLVYALPIVPGAIAVWLIASDRQVTVHERIGAAIVSRLEAVLERLQPAPRSARAQ